MGTEKMFNYPTPLTAPSHRHLTATSPPPHRHLAR